jgi:protein-disulfide isomerase
VLLAGAIGYGIWHARATSPYPVPAHLSANGQGVVAGGSGPVTVDVYTDFGCAACRSFALATEGTLGNMIAAGRITLVYHPLARHDSAANGGYSTRAASSLGCASDLSHPLAYADALWAAEPPGTAGLSDDQLIQVAGSVGVIDPRFARCVREQHYRAWAAKLTEAAGTSRYTITPTVLVNGGNIAPPGASATPAELSAAIAAASSVAAPGK